MSWVNRLRTQPKGVDGGAGLKSAVCDEALDASVAQALVNFKASIHAWSDAELSRPRTALKVVRQRSWRLAAGWALGVALVAGSVSGGVYERHARDEAARVAAAARAAEARRMLAAEQARQEEEDFLAKVDSDVTREVPSAMEPLAQLMAEDETK